MRFRAFLILAMLSGTALEAQQAAKVPVAPELKRAFDEVSAWATAAAEMVPADRYAFRPVETVRTFGQLVGHLADAFNWYCAAAGGNEVEWSDAIEKSGRDKTALIQELKQALARCNAVYAASGRPKPLIDNVGHTSIHYGNMVTYLRIMGLTPPSS